MLPMFDPHFAGLSASGLAASIGMGWVVFCLQVAVMMWALDPKVFNDFFCTGVVITWFGFTLSGAAVVYYWGSPYRFPALVSIETMSIIIISILAINIVGLPILRWIGKRYL